MRDDARSPRASGVLARSVRVAAVVGTGLVLINQSAALFGRASTEGLWWKVPLTYAVPLLVSLYSSVSTNRPGD